MQTKRKVLIYLVLGGIITGHLGFVAIRKDPVPAYNPWPFSNYPMYTSTKFSHSFGKWEIIGVSALDPSHTFVLPEECLPRPASLSAGFHRTLTRSECEVEAEARLGGILSGLGTMYEWERARGRILGDPIQEVRLYRRHWDREEGQSHRYWVEREPEAISQVSLIASPRR